MSRVFIDTSVVGEGWFSDILPELLKSKNIRIAYTDHQKLSDEQARCYKLHQLFSLASKQGIRDDIDSEECDKHVALLQEVDEWKKEKACDDPHIFAMSFIKPIDYVFSKDARMAKCRDCLNSVVDLR